MKATERETVVAVVAVGRVDIGGIEDEVERADCRARATYPVAASDAGVVQGAVRPNDPATDKEKGNFKPPLDKPAGA